MKPLKTPNTDALPMPLPNFLPQAPAGETLEEPARKIPVVAEADVAVLGGGPAGVMAAVAAARCGARVVLVERHAYFGGMATAANVNVWHQLCSLDRTTQVVGGLPEEIVQRLYKMNAVFSRGAGEADGRGPYTLCAESAKLAFDDMVIGSGVKVMLHAWLAGAVRDESGHVTAAIVESKSGRGAIHARVFIDCTGDADLCARAGGATGVGDPKGRCQPPTLCFRLGGLDLEKAAAAGVNDKVIQGKLFADTMDYNGGKYPTTLWCANSVWRKDELMLAGTRVPGVNCAETADFTRAEIEARYQMRWVMEKLRAFPGYENFYLVDIGAQIGVRETRRIIGDYQVTQQELLDGVRFPDTIAQGVYPVDIHNPDGDGIIFRHLDGREVEVPGDGRVLRRRWDGQPNEAPPRDTVCWCLPYRTLLPQGLTNVLVAGRCASATHEAAGALRVMINAMSFGQAAGTAAAQAVQAGHARVRDVDISKLRERLMRDGVPLLPVNETVAAD